MNQIELKDLAVQEMESIRVFNENLVEPGDIIKHFVVNVKKDYATTLRKGIVTSVDKFFIHYTSYSIEEEEMMEYSIHHDDIYDPNKDYGEDFDTPLEAYEVVRV